ncbi:hypothetical protein P280DRAFT_127942 [Massarina eburnea CBS 473.64]|uniref:Zn(2)-C6 fungal-type domain-containing protein n=1 Tax=Massarina eburnea CBS 473.64 TaxID=1395130 RepID=A0A6A6SCW4_9PLEO|nr:hypothetical protein P280DRAFT_127942 [Massarina eburnea CBS 473.64]
MTSTPVPAPAPGAGAAAATSATSSHASHASRRVPLDKRKRTETSCDKCKSRKQKCRKEAGQSACRYCTLHHIECLTTQPRKKRLYGSVEGLGNRLALLESLVKGLLPEADVSNLDEMRQLGLSLGIPLPDAPQADKGAGGEQKSGSGTEGEEPLSLLPDQQGQVQYIGPASSFSFHLKLRSLCGRGTFREFVLFGKNAAEQEEGADDCDEAREARDARHSHSHPPLSTPSAASTADHNSPAAAAAADTPTFESLIGAYFDHINPDFPVLHEASFREAYEGFVGRDKADPAWLCSFLCVLLLSRRVARVDVPDRDEKEWWRRVQTLLPVVIFTSSVMAVQALMLAAIHLHNTNHRDACWNLTGTAVRIAFAIGLHQDKVNTMQTPLARELRKRIWWTLYAFEQMQVSSYDRPSAINQAGVKIGCPNERIIGMASYCPPDYCRWFNQMAVHLGSACRAPKNTKSSSSEESYVGPLSPAAGVMRDLERWHAGLPQHLRIEALETSPPSFHRPLLLLHALYHYTVIVLCRAALLARATSLLKEGTDSTNAALTGMADSCTESGRALSRILLQLESMHKFDPITWWDIFYTLASGSILVLDLVCSNIKSGSNEVSESKILLSQLAELAQRHRRNPHMPGTIEKFASIVPELHSMADSMHAKISPPLATKLGPPPDAFNTRHESHGLPGTSPFQFAASATNSGAYMLADNVSGRFYPENEFAGGPAYSNTRFDRNTQMSFMDFTINNIHDWNWGDLGSLLGNESVPPQVPPGHPPRPGPGTG